MDERVYDLLEKLYLEVQGMKTEISDIKGTMATKEDLENFATKDDLRDFVTKEDLKNLANKEDINVLAEELHTEIQSVYNELVDLRHGKY